MLTLFGKEGLRLIQVYKAQVEDLSQLYELLRDSKKRFILFFDDLSFEPEEDQYRLLKSMLDGDVEERPENVLVYATSNRRNIVANEERALLWATERGSFSGRTAYQFIKDLEERLRLSQTFPSHSLP